jgi:hypothetical protein
MSLRGSPSPRRCMTKEEATLSARSPENRRLRLDQDHFHITNVPDWTYNIILALNYLRREDIDTLAELNALLLDADIVKSEDLTSALSSLSLNKRVYRFYFDPSSNDYLDRFILRGKISFLTEDFSNELQSVTYRTRFDTSDTWTNHSNLAALQAWINTNVTGNEVSGTKYWIKCVPEYKSGQDDQAMNVFGYSVLI